jgi:uncharacterized protein YigE (DUF2233 family)
VRHPILFFVSFILLSAAPRVLAQKTTSTTSTTSSTASKTASAPCPVKWETKRAGIEHREIRCIDDTSDLDVHVVRIDPRKVTLDTVVVSGSNARTIAREHGATFAINASFFDKARTPLGLIVKDGELVNKINNSSWQSVFLVTGRGSSYIILPPSWSEFRNRAHMAVQAGPRLVTRGHTVKVNRGYKAARAGVCIQWDRDLLFFATPQDRKFTTTEIARVARIAEDKGGLACRDAMLFDGGHSTTLFIDGEGSDDVVVHGGPVPVFIVGK